MSIYAEKNKKTKQLIQHSFFSILQIKPFDSITIADITKKAAINRGTFYLHYIDKFDLLEQIEQQLFSDLGSHIDELQAHYLSKQTFEKEQEHLANMLFSFIAKHASMLKIFFGGHGRAGFHLRFRDSFSQKVRFNLEQSEHFYTSLSFPIEYLISFITSAFLGLIEQWIQNDLDKTPQEMTELYINIILFIQKKGSH